MAFLNNLQYAFVRKRKERLVRELHSNGSHNLLIDKYNEILEILNRDKYLFLQNKKFFFNTNTMRLLVLNVRDLVIYGNDIKGMKGITSNLYVNNGSVYADVLIDVDKVFKGDIFKLKDIVIEEISFKKFKPYIYIDNIIQENLKALG